MKILIIHHIVPDISGFTIKMFERTADEILNFLKSRSSHIFNMLFFRGFMVKQK